MPTVLARRQEKAWGRAAGQDVAVQLCVLPLPGAISAIQDPASHAQIVSLPRDGATGPSIAWAVAAG